MFAALLLLCFLLSLLSRSLQRALRKFLELNPSFIFLAPLALSCIFFLTAGYYHCLSWRLALSVAAYTFVPTALISFRNGSAWLRLLVILMIWLPLEFSVGESLIPRPVQGVLHATAYAMAVTLGVILFLLAERWEGMKYKLPQTFMDLRNILFGYMAAALLVIPFGLWVGFLPAPHAPGMPWLTAARRFILIFFGTAFPEEILFRSLIQNWLTERLKTPWKAIAVSGLIFGASHLDNGPGALPNWRYMAVATVAGIIFGTVFFRSTSVLASAAVHAGVNLTKHLFF